MKRSVRKGRCVRPTSALRRVFSRGAKDERGAVAILFAVAILILVPLMLGLLDVFTMTEQRARLQDALDAASLYAARSAAQDDAGVDAIGDQVLTANLKLIRGARLISSDFKLDTAKTKIIAVAKVQTSGLAPKLFAPPELSVDSEVVRAMDKLEVALVLDNTGSMQGTKISTLKTAAADLVDKLIAIGSRSSDPNPVKIALVPFSMTVRVQGNTSVQGWNTATQTDSAGLIPSWIDPKGVQRWTNPGTASYANNDVLQDLTSASTKQQPVDRFALLKNLKDSYQYGAYANKAPWAGCVEARKAPYDIQDDPPTNAATKFVPYFWPDEPDTGSYTNNYLIDDKTAGGSITWKDVERSTGKYPTTSTNQKYTGKASVSSAFGGPYNKGPNMGCMLQPVVRLTTDATTLKTAINAMTPVGETNIPIGLMWGWHALSPNLPFADGSAYGTQHVRKIIILMTDGENTLISQNASNGSFYTGIGYIWQGLTGITSGSDSARTTAIDNRLSQLCTNVKNKNIEVYTVRVEVTTGSSSLLQGCATRPNMFYDVQDVSQLGAVFNAIAGSIDSLRISK